MSNYIGVRCPVCNKKFTEADDIVVCPVCGAPHHRDCYKEAGQCHFAEDHLSGKEWSDPAGEVPPFASDAAAQRTKVCTRCGESNPPDKIFCQVCGNPLAMQPPPQQGQPQAPYGPGTYPGASNGYYGYGMPINTISMAYGGLSPEDMVDGESVKDIAQYIGSGSAYYLPRFKILAEHAHVISVNFSALLFGFLYYFYRKMYLLGAILLALTFIRLVPMGMYIWEYVFPQMQYNLGLGPLPEFDMAHINHLVRLNNLTYGFNFAIVAVMSFLSNRLYFNRVITKVHDIRTSCESDKCTPEQYSRKLSESGGSNKALVVAVIATLMTAAIVAYTVMLNVYANKAKTQTATASSMTQSSMVITLPEEAVDETGA